MSRTLAILAVALVACSSSKKTKRVDIADDDVIMGTGLESADVEAVARMAQSILSVPELTGPDVQGLPTISIHAIENNTRFDFDAELLVRMEKLFGVKLAFRADLNYHVENFKIVNAITGEEYR